MGKIRKLTLFRITCATLVLALLIQLGVFMNRSPSDSLRNSNEKSVPPPKTQSNRSKPTFIQSPTNTSTKPENGRSRAVNRLAAELVTSGKIAQFAVIRLVDRQTGGLNPEISEILNLDVTQSQRLQGALNNLIDTLAFLRSRHCTIEKMDETTLLANVSTFSESGQNAYRDFIEEVASIAGPSKAAALEAIAGRSFQNEFFEFGDTPMGYQLSHTTSYRTPHRLVHLYNLTTIYDRGNSRGSSTSTGPLEMVDGFAPGVLPIFSKELIESITRAPMVELNNHIQ